MPAVSKAQQRFMGMVHAADKGETPASPEVAKVSADMKDSDAKDFASTKHDGLPDHVKEQLKSVVREVIREKNGMNEMSGNDVHFKHIMKMYDRGGSFTKKKIGAVVCKDPKASRKDIEEALFDADYRDIIEFEDELGLTEIREKYSAVNEDIKSDVNKFLDKLNKEFPDQEYTTDFKGGKYARITHQSRKFGQPSAWGFIAMDDNPSKGFQKGDLLKAAGFNTPAKHARGNILKGDAKYDKYSPTYLKESVNEAFSDKKVDAKIIADKMRKNSSTKSFADKVEKLGKVSAEDLDKMLPDFVAGSIIASLFKESVNEGSHGMATKLLQSIVSGDSSRAEGTKMSKELAQHYIDWIRTSPFGKKNGNLPLDMLVKASFNWGIERGLDSKLKGELSKLKSTIKESVNEAPQKVGNVNAFGASKVLGKGKKVLGFVADTPNAVATLIQDFPQAMEIEFKQGFFSDGKLLKSIKKGDKVWKELEKRYLDKQTKDAMKAGFSINEEHDCGCNENHDCGCGGVHEHTHIHEDLSADANGIAGLTASKASAVEDFLEKNNINSNKLYLSLKKGNLKDRMDFVTALVGKPGNPIQKKVISQFSKLVEAKKYDIGSGWMGNGLTIWNRAEEQHGDYKIIAHIGKDGTLSIRDKQLPADIKKMFQIWADSMKKGGRPGTY